MKIVIGVSPSGKANGSDPFIVGSNPATPAKEQNYICCLAFVCFLWTKKTKTNEIAIKVAVVMELAK